MFNYFSVSNIVAGFIAVMVGFTSSAILIVQAATSAGASPAEIGSWLFALGISMTFSCIGLSLYYRTPILTGWSTPGAALLATGLAGVSMPEAIGAFIFAAVLTFLTGITGWFEKAIKHVPRALTSAMLAGILIHFGMNIFIAMKDQFVLIFSMMTMYLIGKRFMPRYTILLVLLSGILSAQMSGLFHLNNFHLSLATPIFTLPVFSLPVLISIGIPLFIITMTTQNIPGVSIIQASGYNPPLSPIISWIGVINTILAPFGSYSICLTSLTAAICTGSEADSNPQNRYKATVFAGICWFFIGLFGATLVSLFYAFPHELILALAGLALLSTMASSLKVALDDETQREPAIITFLVSASGISFYGIGAAFWGLIAGVLSSFLLNYKKKEMSLAGSGKIA
ncbi:MAG: benzoate/H(+) symporter BenE family transporter [Legionella sp.]|nr:benzoate/H(+) symporter BenE family transporter [Legionella sp.]